tara:strand:- start:655 stop:768 length:114 start_codon:yes stop_codon:yes gene_type:complete
MNSANSIIFALVSDVLIVVGDRELIKELAVEYKIKIG